MNHVGEFFEWKLWLSPQVGSVRLELGCWWFYLVLCLHCCSWQLWFSFASAQFFILVWRQCIPNIPSDLNSSMSTQNLFLGPLHMSPVTVFLRYSCCSSLRSLFVKRSARLWWYFTSAPMRACSALFLVEAISFLKASSGVTSRTLNIVNERENKRPLQWDSFIILLSNVKFITEIQNGHYRIFISAEHVHLGIT